MNNTQLLEKVSKLVDNQEIFDKIVCLTGDEFAAGCIGITSKYQLVYSYNKLVDSLVKHLFISRGEVIRILDHDVLKMIMEIPSGKIAPILVHEIN